MVSVENQGIEYEFTFIELLFNIIILYCISYQGYTQREAGKYQVMHLVFDINFVN